MSAGITITHASAADCDEVASLAARTFAATFGHLYTAENLAAHLAKTCSGEYFRAALAEGDVVLMAHRNGAPVGYGKIGKVAVPVKHPPKGAVEIHRAYVDAPYQKQGIGKALVLAMLALPRAATAPVIYISVWEENLGAQALYARYGFKPVGRYLYAVGTQYDREIIMARKRH